MLVLIAICFLFMTGFTPIKEKQVAIIIDDLGNDLKGTKEIFAMKAPLTVAIMPLLPSSKEDALRAKKAGFEVLLHLPMESKLGKRTGLGLGAITTDMSTEEIMRQVRLDLASVPYAVGVNNHMGSKASADKRVVQAVLAVLKEKHLFMVDSRTTIHSKIQEIAKKMGVPYTKRNVFLDNVNIRFKIEKQLHKLLVKGQETGNGVAIGHVGIQGLNTAGAIKSMLPEFKQAGIKIVPISRLVHAP